MEDQDPFKEFGGTVITKSEQDKDPFAEFGGKPLKKKALAKPTTGGSASETGGLKTCNQLGFASGLQPEAFDFREAPVPQQQPKVPQFTPILGRQQQVGLTPQVGATGGFMQDIQANQQGRYSPNQEAMSQKLNKINQMYDKSQGRSATKEAQQATKTQGNLDVGIPTSEREGNRAEYVYNKLLNGVGELTSAFGDLAIQMSPLTPQAGKTANLSNYRKETAGQIRDYLKNTVGADVDKGLEAKYDNEFLTSSIGGLANSIPAMALPPALRTAGFVLQGYDMGLRSIDANDQKGELDDLTKTIYAAGVGTASGLLEKLGFEKLLGAATPSVATTLTNKALREVYEATNGKVTADALTRFLNTNIKDFAETYAKRGVRALEGFGIEAATGGAQEVANIGSEYLLNKATGKSVFDTKDMTSWDGFVDNLKRVAYAAAQEGVGGGIIRGVLNPKARAAIETNEQTLDGINNELERTDLPDTVKEVLVKRKIELQGEIDSGIQEAERTYNKLNPAQQERVNELGEKVDAFNEAIQDPNVSEEVKKDLQQQSDAVQKEIEQIKPESKETITPIISSGDVSVGDEIQLDNGKRGRVTAIDGDNIKLDLVDGGVITTSKPEFLGMNKVTSTEQVAEVPVVEEAVVNEEAVTPTGINETLIEQPALVEQPIEQKNDEVKPTETPEPKPEKVTKEAISEERTEKVIAKADTDLEALKQVKDKTKKHEASLKRLTEAKNKGEITEKQFNTYKKKFDQVLADSNIADITSDNVPTEELTKTKEEIKDAIESREIEQSSEPKREGATEQQQGKQTDRINKEADVTKSKTEAGSSDRATESGKEQETVKAGDAARQFANKIRSGKINKLGGFRASTGFDTAWDLSLETVAQAIDGGARILDAIENGLNQIKKTDWYKNLEGKKEFDESYRSHLKDSFVQDTGYWNNAGKSQLLNNTELTSRIKEIDSKVDKSFDEQSELSALNEENSTRLKQKLLDSDIIKASDIIAEMKDSGRQVIPAKQLVMLEDVIQRYSDPLKLSNADLQNDIKESILRLSKTAISDNTYFADKITLREAVKELSMRDFSNQEITNLVKAEFDNYKYTPDKAEAKIEKFLNPLLTQAKRPISKEIRSFAEKIRNGKINKLGGFRAGTGFDATWDLGLETVALSIEGGAKVAEAIEKGLDAIKQTDWYKNLANQKEFDIQYRDHLNAEYNANDRTTLRNADVADRRKDYGFDERVMPDKVSNMETEAKADQAISEGYDVETLIDEIMEGKSVTAEESVILAKYQGMLQDKLIELNRRVENNVDSTVGSFERLTQQRNKAIDDLIRAYDASEMSGTTSGRALQARKIAVLQDYSLANLFIRKRKAQGNVELTDEQKQEITNTYNKLKETEQKLADKIAELDAKTAELNALNATKRMKRDIEADRRKNRRNQTKDALREERKSIINEISKLANTSRGRVSANPIPIEMIPLVGRLARNLYADGITSLDQIVDNIHGELVNYVDGITKRDVRDAISGYGLDTRATRDELRQQIQDLKTQAKLISQIEDAEAGLSKVRPEQRKAASEEVEMLRARLKDLTRSEDQLHNLKNRLNKQIKEYQKRLEDRDYSKKEVFETVLDEEAQKLQDAYRKIKFDFEVAVQKDILAHRTKMERYRDMAVDVLNVPRSLMATADFSAPLRQGIIPTVSNPLMAGRAFAEAFKQWKSKGKADRWLADLKESDGYQLMKDSKLYIAENNNAQVTAREEEFSSNLAGKIPIIGRLVDASERHYNGFLNKMRVDLFTRGVDVLQDQGMTYANNPDAYKALARYINASTGRGDLGKWLNTSAPILNSLFFSPRLMASRLGLLTGSPLMYKGVPKAVKMMYAKDMARLVGFGLSVLALAAANGADVEPDPRSPDFGKIKRGDTRWDIWAGFQQYIRFFTQFGLGQKKSSASGNITELDGTSYTKETRWSVLGSFIRGKFAPVPAFITNALSGSNVIGEPFSLQNEVPKMLAPLVYQSIYESAQTDGWPFAIGATGIPSMLGVGVQTYGVNNFLQKGVDTKIIKLLTAKKAVAIEPKEGDKKIYDLDTGEERDMTTAEYKKYYDVWAKSIKENLNDNYKDFEKMSVGEFEKAFRSIKMNATKEAKAVVSGVTQGEKTIIEKEVTYQLTPKQIEERQAIKKEFISENGKDILEVGREKALAQGKSAGEAERLAKKLLETEANAYSKQIILEKADDGDGNFKLNKKE